MRATFSTERRVRWLKIVEATTFGLGACVLAVDFLKPDGTLVTPGFISAHDVAICAAAVSISAIASRRLWIWLRGKSIFLILPLVLGALSLVLFSGTNLWLRLTEMPNVGFLYDAGFMCPTNVGVILECRSSDSFVYVLETSCLDPEPERNAYRSSVHGLFMHKLSVVPDAVLDLPISLPKGSTIAAGC